MVVVLAVVDARKTDEDRALALADVIHSELVDRPPARITLDAAEGEPELIVDAALALRTGEIRVGTGPGAGRRGRRVDAVEIEAGRDREALNRVMRIRIEARRLLAHVGAALLAVDLDVVEAGEHCGGGLRIPSREPFRVEIPFVEVPAVGTRTRRHLGLIEAEVDEHEAERLAPRSGGRTRIALPAASDQAGQRDPEPRAPNPPAHLPARTAIHLPPPDRPGDAHAKSSLTALSVSIAPCPQRSTGRPISCCTLRPMRVAGPLEPVMWRPVATRPPARPAVMTGRPVTS